MSDDPARSKWLLIQAARLVGIVMIMIGLAIASGKIDLPMIAGYILIGVGMVETFMSPVWLARRWKSPK